MKKQYFTIRTIFFLCSFFFALNINAQAPEKMSFQAVVRNASNALVTNQNVGIKISILEPLNSTPIVYSETHQTTTNLNGLATIEIGNGTVVSGVFNTIQWDAGSHGIQCEIDPAGGTNYTITTTSQLLSVPYALNSKSTTAISGTTNAIPKFTSNKTIGNSNLKESSFGKIGIGNSNPQQTLDIYDVQPLIRLAAQDGFEFLTGMTWDGQGIVGTVNNSYLDLITNSSSRLKIEANGDVKVNTNLRIGSSGRKTTSLQYGSFGIGSSTNPSKQVTINFPQPMPNTNYVVNVNQVNPAFTDFFQFLILNKTVAGFDLLTIRRDATTGWAQFPEVDWIAVCGQ